jgi:hypothetical protein
MKTIHYLLLFLSMSIFSSCSNDNATIQTNQPQPTATSSRSLPPPIPGELRGFFDVKFNNGVEANMLFEYGNFVSYGSPTITDMLPLSGMRSTYTIAGSVVEFTLFDGNDYTNYRLNYNSITAKFTGTYGFGFSYNNLGTLSGKKHLMENSGFSFAKGIWMGSFNTGAGTSDFDYLMVFEESGKVSVAAYATLYGSAPASGTYTIIGNTIIGSYTYLWGSTFSFKADMIYANAAISGTWGYDSNNNNGGNFTLSSWNFY